MQVETPIRIKNIKAILNDGTNLNYGAQNFIVNIYNEDGDGVILNEEKLGVPEIKIFPNPSNDFIHIQTDEIPTHISILDIHGKTLLEKSMDLNKPIQLSMGDLPRGIYFLKVRIGQQDFVKKVIKQ